MRYRIVNPKNIITKICVILPSLYQIISIPKRMTS